MREQQCISWTNESETHLETGVSSLIFQYSSPGRVEESTQYGGKETEVHTFLYLNLEIEHYRDHQTFLDFSN